MYPFIPQMHTLSDRCRALNGPAAPEQDLCWSLRPGTGNLSGSAAPRLRIWCGSVSGARGVPGACPEADQGGAGHALGRARGRACCIAAAAAPLGLLTPNNGGLRAPAAAAAAAAPGAVAAPRAPRGLRRPATRPSAACRVRKAAAPRDPGPPAVPSASSRPVSAPRTPPDLAEEAAAPASLPPPLPSLLARPGPGGGPQPPPAPARLGLPATGRRAHLESDPPPRPPRRGPAYLARPARLPGTRGRAAAGGARARLRSRPLRAAAASGPRALAAPSALSPPPWGPRRAILSRRAPPSPAAALTSALRAGPLDPLVCKLLQGFRAPGEAGGDSGLCYL